MAKKIQKMKNKHLYIISSFALLVMVTTLSVIEYNNPKGVNLLNSTKIEALSYADNQKPDFVKADCTMSMVQVEVGVDESHGVAVDISADINKNGIGGSVHAGITGGSTTHYETVPCCIASQYPGDGCDTRYESEDCKYYTE